MSGTDFVIGVGFIATLFSVRFLLPIGICWLISAVDHRYFHSPV